MVKLNLKVGIVNVHLQEWSNNTDHCNFKCKNGYYLKNDSDGTYRCTKCEECIGEPGKYRAGCSGDNKDEAGYVSFDEDGTKNYKEGNQGECKFTNLDDCNNLRCAKGCSNSTKDTGIYWVQGAKQWIEEGGKEIWKNTTGYCKADRCGNCSSPGKFRYQCKGNKEGICLSGKY